MFSGKNKNICLLIILSSMLGVEGNGCSVKTDNLTWNFSFRAILKGIVTYCGLLLKEMLLIVGYS